MTHRDHSLPTDSSSSIGSSIGICWKDSDLIYSINIGFSFIFPNLPATFDRFLVSLSNNTSTSLAEKFRHEQLFLHNFLTRSALKSPPLSASDVTSSVDTTGGYGYFRRCSRMIWCRGVKLAMVKWFFITRIKRLLLGEVEGWPMICNRAENTFTGIRRRNNSQTSWQHKSWTSRWHNSWTSRRHNSWTSRWHNSWTSRWHNSWTSRRYNSWTSRGHNSWTSRGHNSWSKTGISHTWSVWCSKPIVFPL